jgi:hypothetical protein
VDVSGFFLEPVLVNDDVELLGNVSNFFLLVYLLTFFVLDKLLRLRHESAFVFHQFFQEFLKFPCWNLSSRVIIKDAPGFDKNVDVIFLNWQLGRLCLGDERVHDDCNEKTQEDLTDENDEQEEVSN